MWRIAQELRSVQVDALAMKMRLSYKLPYRQYQCPLYCSLQLADDGIDAEASSVEMFNYTLRIRSRICSLPAANEGKNSAAEHQSECAVHQKTRSGSSLQSVGLLHPLQFSAQRFIGVHRL